MGLVKTLADTNSKFSSSSESSTVCVSFLALATGGPLSAARFESASLYDSLNLTHLTLEDVSDTYITKMTSELTGHMANVCCCCVT